MDDGAISILQDALLLCVVLYELCQRRKLLASVQVIEIARVLDPNMGHLIPHPAGHQVVRPVGARVEVGDTGGMGWYGAEEGAHTHTQRGRGHRQGRDWGDTLVLGTGEWALPRGNQERGAERLALAGVEGHLPDGEGEVTLVLATGPSQEAPMDAAALEQSLRVQPAEVSVKPPAGPPGSSEERVLGPQGAPASCVPWVPGPYLTILGAP